MKTQLLFDSQPLIRFNSAAASPLPPFLSLGARWEMGSRVIWELGFINPRYVLGGSFCQELICPQLVPVTGLAKGTSWKGGKEPGFGRGMAWGVQGNHGMGWLEGI